MITFTTGNIFDSQAQVLVNTVNCVGVMGAGLALQFKKRYPDNFTAYRMACLNGEVRPGHSFLFITEPPGTTRLIVNFPTKRHWRDQSRIEDIEEGLKDLRKVIQDLHLRSIAIPPLGAGLGGLDWAQVKPLIQSNLEDLEEVEITVYEPATSETKH